MYAKSKEAFAEAAKGLPFLSGVFGDVVTIEPVSASYFQESYDQSRQRCIVRHDGKLYLSYYD